MLGQVARTVDDTRRTTISTNEAALSRQLERFGRKQIAKIPGASMTLEPYVDLWGRTESNGNAIENFLSPGYWRSKNITPVDEELDRLIPYLDADVAKEIIPPKREYTFTEDKQGYRLSEAEYTQFLKTSGQTAYNGLERLFQSLSYEDMSLENKVSAIKKTYDLAKEKARNEYFESKGMPVESRIDSRAKELGITEDKYNDFVVLTAGSDRPAVEKKFVLATMPDLNAEQKAWLSETVLDNGKYEQWGPAYASLAGKMKPNELVKIDEAVKAAGEGDPYTRILKSGKNKGQERTEAIPAGSPYDTGAEGHKSKDRKQKEAIDAAYPDADKETREALYTIFGVSEKVWGYKR